jgi:hypothetical protein
MLRISLLAAWLLTAGPLATAYGQGCMAVRGSGHCPGAMLSDFSVTQPPATTHAWQLSLSYRHFRSDRHFVGDDERELPRSQVVENTSRFYDIIVQRMLADRYSVALTIPFVDSQRRAAYEHDGIHRYASHAGGLSDIRVTGFAWLLEPAEHSRGNLRLGVGVKLPTGAYDVQDTFHTTNGPVRRAVDQSIQPGDGGYGFTLEAMGMLEVSARVRAYIEGFYLFNPEEENGVETDIGTDNPYYRTMSITDQYLARSGVTYNMLPERGLSFALGLQVEGVPAEDLLGGNKGFRRPGYAISIDPGVSLARGAWGFLSQCP